MSERSRQRPAKPIANPVQPEPASPLRGRLRRTAHLAEHFARTSQLIGAGPEDDDVVARSRGLLRRHVDAVVDEVYRRLLARPQTAIQFSAARARIDMRRETFRRWLLAVIDGPLDASMSEYVASVGHAHARPREPASRHIRASFLLITMSWLQGLVLAILADEYTDVAEFARQSSAWCRRLMLQLDLLLAVYGSTEGTAHWY